MDAFKKAIMLGLGIASLTRDKLAEITDEMVEMGKMSEDEAQKFIEKIQAELHKAQGSFNEKVEDIVDKAVDKMPCHKIWEDVNERLARIEEKLDALSAGKNDN